MRYISFLEFLDFRILLKSFLGGRRCGRWWRDPRWATKTSAAHPPARTYWGDCQRVFIFENEISGISRSQKSSADLYTTSSSMKMYSFDLAVSSNVEPKTTWSKSFLLLLPKMTNHLQVYLLFTYYHYHTLTINTYSENPSVMKLRIHHIFYIHQIIKV